MKVILLAIVVALATGLLAQNAAPQRNRTSSQIELFAQFGKEQTWAGMRQHPHGVGSENQLGAPPDPQSSSRGPSGEFDAPQVKGLRAR